MLLLLVGLVFVSISPLNAAAKVEIDHPAVFEPAGRPGEYVSRGLSNRLLLNKAGIEFQAGEFPSVRMVLIGGSRVEPRGIEPQTSVTNYLVGNDESKWRAKVPNFGAIVYRGIYPGIDLTVYGAGNTFEYDFMIAPHADPSRIVMEFDGAEDLRVNDQGDLEVNSVISQRKPRVFQGNKAIPGAFRVRSDKQVSFDVGAFDPLKPLLIDPLITYVTYLGGARSDQGLAITTDPAGNVYLAGNTGSVDFPGTPADSSRPSGLPFVFLSKFAPVVDGKTKLLYTTLLGDNRPTAYAIVHGVALDQEGNIILVGYTNSAGFPTKNAFQPVHSGDPECGGDYPAGCVDGFVTKIAPDGHTLIFSTFLGNGSFSELNDVAVDSSGNIYAVGEGGAFLKETPGAIPSPRPHASPMIAVRYDPAGNLTYVTYVGGDGIDEAHSVAVEKSGVIWVGGTTISTDMPLGPGNSGVKRTYTSSGGGDPLDPYANRNAYIARIDMNQAGASLTYATYFNGTKGATTLSKLFLDSSGQIVFCGSTDSDIPVTPTRLKDFVGAPDPHEYPFEFSDSDAYLARIDPKVAGVAGVTYATFIGGSDSETAIGCLEDGKGNFLVAGSTYSTDYFAMPGSPIPVEEPYLVSSASNVFFIRIDPAKAGGRIDSFLVGGEGYDYAYGMAVDNRGSAYITGLTISDDFPATANALQRSDLSFSAFLLATDLTKDQIPVDGVILESGDLQFAPINSTLPAPVMVHLVDAAGNPLSLSGYAVTFAADGGRIINGRVFTDGAGIAATNIRMDRADATIQASVEGGTRTYTFHLKGITGPLPKSVGIVSGDKQTGRANSGLLRPLVIELRDANNARVPLSGITIQFLPSNAITSTQSVVTDSDGRASTFVTLGKLSGAAEVQVIVGGLPVVTATYTVTPVVRAGGLVSGATFLAVPVSPGLIVTLFGTGIGPSALATAKAGADGKFANMLAETQVLFDGIPAPVLYVSSAQTGVIVPYSIAGKSTTQVSVLYQGLASTPFPVDVVPAQLGLFSADSSGAGQGAILNQDNSANSSKNPAKPRSIVILFGTGEGATSPAAADGQVASGVYPKPLNPITVRIGGKDAEVLYYGAAPSLVAGVFQLNVRIPDGVADGNASVEVFEGSLKSLSVVTVAVREK
jgi:uncharacterized protein (TIGR03437 family)